MLNCSLHHKNRFKELHVFNRGTVSLKYCYHTVQFFPRFGMININSSICRVQKRNISIVYFAIT